MKKAKKAGKILILILLAVLMISFFAGFVVADTTPPEEKQETTQIAAQTSESASVIGRVMDNIIKGIIEIGLAYLIIIIIVILALIAMMSSKNTTIKAVASVILIILVVLFLSVVTLGKGEKFQSTYMINFDNILTVTGEKLIGSAFLPEDEAQRKLIEPIYKYIFGFQAVLEDMDKNLTDLTVRGFIILLAVFIIFLLSFMDFFATFSLIWRRGIGMAIGALLTIVLANIGAPYKFLVGLMTIFSFFAGIAIIIAFFSVIIVMVGVHFGLENIKEWIDKRNAMLLASRARISTEKAMRILKGAAEGVEAGTKEG